jgi:hypothetical protein
LPTIAVVVYRIRHGQLGQLCSRDSGVDRRLLNQEVPVKDLLRGVMGRDGGFVGSAH